jgi:hypothetical protein
MNEKKIGKALEDLMKVINKHKLSAIEQTMLYGNLGYSLGASIGGYKGTGPSIEALKKNYYSNPTLADSLMLQGLEIILWVDTPKEEEETNE